MEQPPQPGSHNESYAELLDITVRAVFVAVEVVITKFECMRPEVMRQIRKGIESVKEGQNWNITISPSLIRFFEDTKYPIDYAQRVEHVINTIQDTINTNFVSTGIVEYRVELTVTINTDSEVLPTQFELRINVVHTGITEESLQAT